MNGWIDLTLLIPSLSGRNVHLRPEASLDRDAEILARSGFRVCQIDGSSVHDAATFLAEAGRALGLPKHYGNNWDALVDCLGDLTDGADRRIAVLWKDARHLLGSDPQTFVDALITLDRAAFDAAASDDPVQTEVFLYYGAAPAAAVESRGASE